MTELTVLQMLIVLAAALCCGFAKTGIATLGIFNAMLMSQAFSAKEAVGTLLPMLIAADVTAVLLYLIDRASEWNEMEGKSLVLSNLWMS
ncbi:hypothetical protein [Paenibacillus sp. UNC496MF]|uniref:hypothetical protein n=1 Tax=Paenibacillus sp. UNC496MF TaxID=1502753 RepID=UPI000B89B692|nr:hypothetical protein [Paenibacillus sp. UNC496MF]